MSNEMLGKVSKFESSGLSYEWTVREKPQGGADSAPPDSNRVNIGFWVEIAKLWRMLENDLWRFHIFKETSYLFNIQS